MSKLVIRDPKSSFRGKPAAERDAKRAAAGKFATHPPEVQRAIVEAVLAGNEPPSSPVAVADRLHPRDDGRSKFAHRHPDEQQRIVMEQGRVSDVPPATPPKLQVEVVSADLSTAAARQPLPSPTSTARQAAARKGSYELDVPVGSPATAVLTAAGKDTDRVAFAPANVVASPKAGGRGNASPAASSAFTHS